MLVLESVKRHYSVLIQIIRFDLICEDYVNQENMPHCGTWTLGKQFDKILESCPHVDMTLIADVISFQLIKFQPLQTDSCFSPLIK